MPSTLKDSHVAAIEDYLNYANVKYKKHFNALSYLYQHITWMMN